MLMEDSFIYFPSRYPEGNWNTEGRGKCRVEDVSFEADDGVKTHGWFLENPGTSKVIVYYHGNAGSIADRYEWGCQLTDSGASVLMAEYRGYGRSEGKPGEEGFYRDAEAVWAWLTKTKGYAPQDIVIYGKSLGGGVAGELAARHTPGALVLQSTFTSITEMAKIVLPVVPSFMLKTRFDTFEKLPLIQCPVLVIHSRSDEVIPFAMGESLAAQAPNLKHFIQFSGYGHNDLIAGKGGEIVQGIADLIAH